MAISRLLDRGREEAVFYRVTEQRDARGNRVKVASPPGIRHRVTVAEDRQSKAELTGQVDFYVVRMHLRADAVISSWDMVWFRDSWWEPANPPHNSAGLSNARHQELLLREANQDSVPYLEAPE